MSSLVVHVPHASTTIPDDVWQEFLVSRESDAAEANTSADIYSVEMARQAWPQAKIIQAQVSRIVVDVERYEDDSKEEMAAVGRGAIYTHDHNQIEIRKRLSGPHREELLAQYYWPHWRELRAHAAGSILIDLHTYPAKPWVVERHARWPRPEIDIGFTEGLTPSDWVSALSEHFELHGYEVGHNLPYAGVVDAGARAAVMIEIRRDVVGRPGADLKWQRLISALSTAPVGV